MSNKLKATLLLNGQKKENKFWGRRRRTIAWPRRRRRAAPACTLNCQNGARTSAVEPCSCACNQGYELQDDGVTCGDINECLYHEPELLYTNEHPTSEVATATGCTNGHGVANNRLGGFDTCLDICKADQTCNFVWIYGTSGKCCFKSSMTVNAAHPLRTNNAGGGGHYYKVNHASNNCPGDATCANTDGSHTCTCDHPGYHLDSGGTSCIAYAGTCAHGKMIAQSLRTQENHCGTCSATYYLLINAHFPLNQHGVPTETLCYDGAPTNAQLAAIPSLHNGGQNLVRYVGNHQCRYNTCVLGPTG